MSYINLGNYCQNCGTYLAPGTAMGTLQKASCLDCAVKRLNECVPNPEYFPTHEGYEGTVIKTVMDRVKSDGGKTSYYELPPHATELRHLISHKGMSFARGNLMKALYRLGEKEGTDVLYDLEKMEFFIQDLKEMHERGEPL